MDSLEKQSKQKNTTGQSNSVALDQLPAEPSDSGPDPGRLPPTSLGAVSVGRIVAVQQTVPLVDFPANASGALVQARSVVPITRMEIGREVALAFEENDPTKPLVLGVLQASGVTETLQPSELEIDDDVLSLTARKEITIRCGKASITLTSAGKVLIRGEYLLSRSSGVNRIKGGSVQIN
jgi:hypothetical protein